MTREEAKRELLFAKREVMADSWIDKAYDVAISALEQPEIVRCGECKYMMPDGRCFEFADDNIRPSVSDFCSAAARRNEGD